VWAALDFDAFSKEIIDTMSQGDETKSFFLDYDGTLREFEDNPEDAAPSDELLDIFSKLHSRLNFDVNIISGRDMDFLDKHFGKYRFTLAAEQGYLIRRPGCPWAAFNPDADLSWIKDVEKIFSLYALSTPGSAVEVKRSSIVWHYRKADPEFGMWKATHLIGELTEAVSNLPVEIQHQSRVVEVRLQQVSKGIIVDRLLKDRNEMGAVLCMGDDQTDESMLQLKRPNLFSIKVGEGPTSATYRIASPTQARALLGEILSAR
jgi:trehalose 6-phosphate synthase/phosphatase